MEYSGIMSLEVIHRTFNFETLGKLPLLKIRGSKLSKIVKLLHE